MLMNPRWTTILKFAIQFLGYSKPSHSSGWTWGKIHNP